MKIVDREHGGKPVYLLEVRGVAYEIHPRGRRWALQRIRASGDLTKPLTILDSPEECREVAVWCEEALADIENLEKKS